VCPARPAGPPGPARVFGGQAGLSGPAGVSARPGRRVRPPGPRFPTQASRPRGPERALDAPMAPEACTRCTFQLGIAEFAPRIVHDVHNLDVTSVRMSAERTVAFLFADIRARDAPECAPDAREPAGRASRGVARASVPARGR